MSFDDSQPPKNNQKKQQDTYRNKEKTKTDNKNLNKKQVCESKLLHPLMCALKLPCFKFEPVHLNQRYSNLTKY